MTRSELDIRKNEQGGRKAARLSDPYPVRRGGYEPFAFSPGEFFANPFSLMRRMHEEMDRIFTGALGTQTGLGAIGGGLSTWMPAIEVSDRDNEVSVCAELPGLRPEDVKVEITDDALIIAGERKEEREEKDRGRAWHSERRYGAFQRSIPLPEGAKADQAKADFRNGELRVTVPVQRTGSKRRQVPISGVSAVAANQG